MDDDGGSGGEDSNKKEGENTLWSSYVSPTLLSALLKFSHLLNEAFQKGETILLRLVNKAKIQIQISWLSVGPSWI